VKDIPIKGIQIIDILVLWFSTLILFASLFVWKRHRISKIEGFIMLLCYVAYTVFLIIRG
ncbi:MAG: hypothetical protein ACD_50C00231G0001, partial [uncultured bacterium]